MSLQFTVFDQAVPTRAGTGPSSRRTLISCVPRVCMSYTPKGIDLNLPRNGYMPIEKWVAAMHMQTGNQVQGAYHFSSLITENRYPDNDDHSLGAMLLALTVTKSRVRAVGSRMSKAEKFTVFVRAVEESLTGKPVILKFSPVAGSGFTLFSGRGFLLSADTVVSLMPVLNEGQLTAQFGQVLSDFDDFTEHDISLHTVALTPDHYGGTVQAAAGALLHEEDWFPYFLSADEIIVSERGRRESVVVADKTPARKRKLLFKRK